MAGAVRTGEFYTALERLESREPSECTKFIPRAGVLESLELSERRFPREFLDAQTALLSHIGRRPMNKDMDNMYSAWCEGANSDPTTSLCQYWLFNSKGIGERPRKNPIDNDERTRMHEDWCGLAGHEEHKHCKKWEHGKERAAAKKASPL